MEKINLREAGERLRRYADKELGLLESLKEKELQNQRMQAEIDAKSMEINQSEIHERIAEETFIESMYYLELQQVNHVKNSLGRILDYILIDNIETHSVDQSNHPLVKCDPYHPALELTLDTGVTEIVRDNC
ncbi:unnamed protein product [Ceutorhynchus assimilis]|uniref:Uncharacterized protein n=1 Tax=Ceutorhynchus assimilis TaxID=467358 RepID=A0A9N9MQD4_9CUCU|nr:unnamed protein product [Ceutorhynchus assimilis]